MSKQAGVLLLFVVAVAGFPRWDTPVAIQLFANDPQPIIVGATVVYFSTDGVFAGPVGSGAMPTRIGDPPPTADSADFRCPEPGTCMTATVTGDGTLAVVTVDGTKMYWADLAEASVGKWSAITLMDSPATSTAVITVAGADDVVVAAAETIVIVRSVSGTADLRILRALALRSASRFRSIAAVVCEGFYLCALVSPVAGQKGYQLAVSHALTTVDVTDVTLIDGGSAVCVPSRGSYIVCAEVMTGSGRGYWYFASGTKSPSTVVSASVPFTLPTGVLWKLAASSSYDLVLFSNDWSTMVRGSLAKPPAVALDRQTSWKKVRARPEPGPAKFFNLTLSDAPSCARQRLAVATGGTARSWDIPVSWAVHGSVTACVAASRCPLPSQTIDAYSCGSLGVQACLEKGCCWLGDFGKNECALPVAGEPLFWLPVAHMTLLPPTRTSTASPTVTPTLPPTLSAPSTPSRDLTPSLPISETLSETEQVSDVHSVTDARSTSDSSTWSDVGSTSTSLRLTRSAKTTVSISLLHSETRTERDVSSRTDTREHGNETGSRTASPSHRSSPTGRQPASSATRVHTSAAVPNASPTRTRIIRTSSATTSRSMSLPGRGRGPTKTWPAATIDAAIGAVMVATAAVFFGVMLLRKRQTLPRAQVHEEYLGLLEDQRPAPDLGTSPREGSVDAADIDDAVPTYVPGDRIGRGGYGAVFEGRRNDGTQVAIKYVPMVTDEDEDATMEEVQAVMLLQGHPNIIPILAMNLNGRGVSNAPLDQRVADRMRRAMLRNTAGAGLFSESRCAIIVTPLYERGDVRRYVNTYASTHRHVPAAEAVRFAIQLCSAVRYAHDRNVVHRDLKPENMLLTVAGDMILTDFGLSKIVERADQTLHTRAGSLPYVAPECFHGIYSARVDNWSVGCVMYAIGAGRVNADNTRQMFQEVRRSSFEEMVRRDLASYPKAYIDVALALVRFRPQDRMQLADAEAALSAIRL